MRGMGGCGPHYPWHLESGRWYVCGRNWRSYRWSRVVMENELGRALAADEHVHHRNQDRTDDRPENLEVLSAGAHARLHNSERSHCKHGHPFDDANTYWRPDGARGCRRCLTISKRRYEAARRAA